MNKSKGFTLIEISIVLVIIGLILGAVLMRSESVIGGAKTTGMIALIKDLTAAINDFKSRYHYLPGDMPKAGDDISGISASCNIATTTANIGDGQVNTADEVNCVAEHLVQAGLIKGSASGIFSQNNASITPDVFFTARRTIGSLPPAFSPTVLNEIELTNQPCETAKGIDSKLDDGDFATGNIRASVTSCTPGSSNDPVPYLDIAF